MTTRISGSKIVTTRISGSIKLLTVAALAGKTDRSKKPLRNFKLPP